MAEPAAFEIVTCEALEGIPHGFFGHSGGAHQFGYGGQGEDASIARIRAAAADAILPGGTFVAPHQVHSPDVIKVTEAWGDTATGRPEADALVTATSGLVLGIVTADCAPVLFADREAGVVGAAHAGWRGARGGVLENTIAAMESLGASRDIISAAIGPTIAQSSYEVDARFRENFAAQDYAHFQPGREGRWQFDLPGYVKQRLRAAGLRRIEDCALDTYTIEKSYYSFRRATHAGEASYGRQLSLIAKP